MNTIDIKTDTTKINKSRLRVVIQGSLALDREQEDNLMLQVVQQLKDTKTEMGWVDKNSYSGHLEKRSIAWAEYNNDFKHRENGSKYGPLYKLFNNSLNIPKRAVRVFRARACEVLVNTEPFAGMTPEGIEDLDDGVKVAERYFQHKIKEADGKTSFREAIEQAAVSGEAIMKITSIVQRSTEQKTSKVWMGPDGYPVRDSRNRMVREDTPIEDDPHALNGRRLVHDPATKLTSAHYLSPETKIAVETITQRKLSMERVGWEDFFCPLTAKNIHEATAIHQTFDAPMDRVWGMTQGMTLSPEAAAWRRGILTVGGDPKSGESQPVFRNGENEDKPTGTPGVLGLCETYIRFDADNTGYATELYVLWEVTTQGGYPIYYDHLSVVSPTKSRPYRVIRAVPQRGRWYGMGFYELLSNEHGFIDRQWNRIDARNSTSGRLTWTRDNAFVEQKYGIPIEFNNPRVYTLDSSVEKASEAFGCFQLPALDENIWKMLTQALQAAQLMTGTMTPSDAEASSLDINKTATGINSLTAESELMSGDTIQDLQKGIFETLQDGAMCIFSDFISAHKETKQDAIEELTTLVGEVKATQMLEWLSKNPPNKLMYHVRLLLTKARSKQQFEANNQAWGFMVGKASWQALVTQVQQGILSIDFLNSIKPMFKAMLDALDIQNSEMMLSYTPVSLVPPTGQETPPSGGAPVGQAPPAGMLPQGQQAPLQNTDNFTPNSPGATGQAAFQSQKP
jgi:hypothetical protein